MKTVSRALIIASAFALASFAVAQDQNAPPPVTPGVTDQTASPAAPAPNPATVNPPAANPDTSAAPNAAAPVPVPQDSGVAPAPTMNANPPAEAAPSTTTSSRSAKSTSSRSARRNAKTPKPASPAPSADTNKTDQGAAAAGAAGSTSSDQQPPSAGSGTTGEPATTQSTSTAAAQSAVPPAPVAEQRPVVVNEDATSNAHTASRSLWLLIAGVLIAVLIVVSRIARGRRDTDISIRGDRTGPIRTDGGPAFHGRS